MIAASAVYICISLYSGCSETLISEIVPYSGSWSFSFSYTGGNVFANSVIIIQDTGAFCGELYISETNTIMYIQGDVSGDGKISGGFADNCSGTVRGNMNGTFTELMGAGYASGTFSDTLQNAAYKGTWRARRN